jgi:hypothetical protein
MDITKIRVLKVRELATVELQINVGRDATAEKGYWKKSPP